MEETITEVNHRAPEMASLILQYEAARAKDAEKGLTGHSSKYVRAFRRKIRYKIFRIREGKWQTDRELAALKAWFDIQNKDIRSYTWDNFTFTWDVSFLEPLKVISPMEWDGRIEKTAHGTFCDPAAFTEQEK